MPDVPHDPDSVEELTAVAGGLKSSIDTLSANFDVLSGKAESNRRIVIALGVVSTVLTATVIALVAVVIGLNHTNHRLETSLRNDYTTSQQQSVTRTRVLCPLYQFVLAQASPATRAALPPDRQKQYDAELKVFQDGYAALKCT